MEEKNQKKIFFHVGTGKTGTTFLQYRIFPKFKGIYYIQRTRFRRAKNIINSTHYNNYLLSREFDQQLEKRVKSFAEDFPETTAIIVFRRHDSYIASQYRRFVKNGFTGSFTEFFDVENDKGYFRKKDLDYYWQIGILEKNFKPKPIVLFYEDFSKDPRAFIDKLVKLLDVSVNHNKLNLKRKHSSYSEKQLKAILVAGKYINLRKRRIFKSGFLHFIWRLYLGSMRYPILFFSKCIPEKFFTKEPLIPEAELEKVRAYYQADWEKCHDYTENFSAE